MKTFFYKNLLFWFYCFLNIICFPIILILDVLKVYKKEKFATDLLFLNPVINKLMYSIFQFETANFTSSLYKRANNVIGMGIPKETKFWVGKENSIIANDGKKSYYSFYFVGIYDVFLWLKFRIDVLEQLNVVSNQSSGTKESNLQECFSILTQKGFTTTPPNYYYKNMKPYLDAWTNTYYYALFVIFMVIYFLYWLIIKKKYKLLKKILK